MHFGLFAPDMHTCIDTSNELARVEPDRASAASTGTARDRQGMSVLVHFRRRSGSIGMAQVAGGSQRPVASLRARIAAWSGIAAADFKHALIAEYRTGRQLGWHRDFANFDAVVGVSLAGAARMRFRPYPPVEEWRRSTFTLDLTPRSVYALQGPARWQWQHAISATKTLRYSITFRTLTAAPGRRGG
jgi:2OG-Fe(II) oxygenase superfamily